MNGRSKANFNLDERYLEDILTQNRLKKSDCNVNLGHHGELEGIRTPQNKHINISCMIYLYY